jgi:hypothetical protein
MTRADRVGITLKSTETFVSSVHLNELLQQRASRTSINTNPVSVNQDRSTPGRSTCTNLGRTRRFLPRKSSSAFKSFYQPLEVIRASRILPPTLYESRRKTHHHKYTLHNRFHG